MSEQSSVDGVGIKGEVTASVYDVSVVKQQYEDWNTLSQSEKYTILTSYTPETEIHSCNVTVTDLHEYIVRDLNPTNTSAADNITASHAGIGDNAGAGIVSSDTNLNNLLVSKQILDSVSNGTTLTSTFLLESTEANGKSINEIGIASGNLTNIGTDSSVFLLNHASFTTIEKDNKNSVTFTVELTFANA